MKKILFLCTGNYYRSRFSEELFNYLAVRAGLDWEADSGALDFEKSVLVNPGPISSFALDGLEKRGVPIPPRPRYPKKATLKDFAHSDLVIALKEDEHRPLMQERFPAWADRITYWHIHDLDILSPDEALPELEQLIRALIEQLAGGSRPRGIDLSFPEGKNV